MNIVAQSEHKKDFVKVAGHSDMQITSKPDEYQHYASVSLPVETM